MQVHHSQRCNGTPLSVGYLWKKLEKYAVSAAIIWQALARYAPMLLLYSSIQLLPDCNGMKMHPAFHKLKGIVSIVSYTRFQVMMKLIHFT